MKKKKILLRPIHGHDRCPCRDAEVAPFDKENLLPGKPLSAAERKTFERIIKRGRPRIGLGAEKIRVSLERELLAKSDQLARRLHISRSELIASGLRKCSRLADAITP